MLARGLDETAIARLAAAARGDGAGEASVVVGPDDDAAAVTGGAGVGADYAVATYIGTLGVLDSGVLALIVAANEDLAAAGFAGGVDDPFAEDANAHAERLHFAAVASAALGFDGAVDEVGAALSLQQDLAAAAAARRNMACGFECQVLRGDKADLAAGAGDGAFRLRDAGIAHERAEHADAACIGDEAADVERFLSVSDDLDGDVWRGFGHQLGARAGGEDDFTLRGADDAAVLYVRGDEVHPPA